MKLSTPSFQTRSVSNSIENQSETLKSVNINNKPQYIPPINLATSDWRKVLTVLMAAPTSDTTAKISVNGSVHVQTTSSENFRVLNNTLKESKIDFHTYPLPEDRILKVVIKVIPKDISEDEVSDEHTGYAFDDKVVKRFGKT